jgi:magnesium transporter
MSDAKPQQTSVSNLVGISVLDPAGRVCGRVQEFAVDVAKDSGHVHAFVLHERGAKRNRRFLTIGQIHMPSPDDTVLRAASAPESSLAIDDYLLLERDLLDQQIIDMHGHKVVRVNDVNLAWEGSSSEGMAQGLRIDEVEVGVRGAARRLLKGLPMTLVDRLVSRLPGRTIPWGYVDLIDRDPARRVKLKIEQEKLSKLHPSDIAAILEELAPAEREAIFTSLPEETAAETLEEFEPKMQKALLQGLDSERAADIIEEMDPGAAADLLSELSHEQSDAILEEMEPEERHDVEELLEFSPHSAAGRMTTDFVDVSVEGEVTDAVNALKVFEGDLDTITEIYLVDAEHRLHGVVTLPRLLLAESSTMLETLSEGHLVSCKATAKNKEVAELFDKYNLRSLPVLGPKGEIVGVIHAEQVIAQLRED